MNNLNTPVAFIIFNRPDLAQIVFNAIREAQPKQLFVIADGARFPEEAEKCQQARHIIKQVDWDCKVLTNYADNNLGCRQRVSSGISWVFEQVEEAIILEDDCLPHPSFFPYCETLLDHYRDDKRVMAISGDNFQDGHKRTKYSYYFSKYSHCWGWASWRRAWKHWEFQPEKWIEFRDGGLMKFVCDHPYEEKYWTAIFNTLFLEGKPNSWAYPWAFTCWSQGGLTALPSVNLVSNIGFRVDATHTVGESKLANMLTQDIGEIHHPPFVLCHREADIYTFDYVFGGQGMRDSDTMYGKLRQRVSSIKQRTKRLLTAQMAAYTSVYQRLISK
ncbi:glycosyltransferase family protein [Umezakia ovalisporum]|uniref:Glycosyltransferase family 2 protein n=1 Tax=Umezakia ovalisporum FSS-62 TaxID=2971776 RepID=A0AA43GY57_9CYAN|nr:glycosyltransferase family 2 protein [Umezakia ovalisporum]MDH6063302.1 glycosyltransferase family 2 protein [Umezakia ovalisporum FSS-62]